MKHISKSKKNSHVFTKITTVIIIAFIFLLPTQFGKHFWPHFSYLLGIRVDYLSPTLYVTDITIIIIMFLYMIQILKRQTSLKNAVKALRKTAMKHRLFSFFLLYLFINVYTSNNTLSSIYSLLKVIEYSFLFFVLSTTLNIYKMQFISFIAAISVLGESILSFIQYLHQGSLGGILYFFGERSFTSDTPGIANASINGQLLLRPYGTFPHPNVLAGYLLIMLILISSFLPRETNIYKKTIEFATLFVGTISLLITLSRIAIIVWIALLILALVSKLSRLKKKHFVINSWLHLASIACLIFCCMLVFKTIFFTIFLRFSQTNFSEEALIQRKDLIQSSITIISQHPLFGVGLNNFLPTLSQIRSPFSAAFYLQPVHNIFLLWTAETGFIGLTFLIILIIAICKRLVRLYRLKNPYTNKFIAIFGTIIFLGTFDHYFLTLQQGQLVITLALSIIFSNIVQKETNSKMFIESSQS